MGEGVVTSPGTRSCWLDGAAPFYLVAVRVRNINLKFSRVAPTINTLISSLISSWHAHT